MSNDFLIEHLHRESNLRREAMMDASRWRGTATQLANTIIDYLHETKPADNIPEWLYRNYAELYDALERHSNRLHGDPDRWLKEFQPDDI